MTGTHQTGTSRLWLVALVPITALAAILFIAIVPRLSDARSAQHFEARLAALVVAGFAGAYGLAEILACGIRHRTFLHPAIAFLVLVLGFAVALYFLPIRKRSVGTRIIPELRPSNPTPSP
jgi:hypothetical protein